MAGIIEIKGLSKTYGSLTALKDLSLSIEEGAVFGFIGPNGAGKTTTLRILTTLLQPTSGEAWIAGHSVRQTPQKVRSVIGYMPDYFGVYDDMKVWEYLEFFAGCYRITPAISKAMVHDLLVLVDLAPKQNEFVENLSRGMKQRLCLARTLIHDPQVLILDEPASGLDPRARIEIRELLRELQRMGKTIFFSSHILSEVADICTSIGIIEAGELVIHGDLEMMKRQLKAHRLIEVRLLGDSQPLADLLEGQKLVSNIAKGTEANLGRGVVRFDFAGQDAQLSDLLSEMVQRDLQVISFHEEMSDLEDVFLQVTQGILN